MENAEAEMKDCPFCAEKINVNAKKCPHCGEILDPVLRAAQEKSNIVPKSRLAYILLGLFLGGFGIHNFYAGYSGRGIAQLLITLFLFWTVVAPIAIFIWVIIEICTVAKDAQGVPFN